MSEFSIEALEVRGLINDIEEPKADLIYYERAVESCGEDWFDDVRLEVIHRINEKAWELQNEAEGDKPEHTIDELATEIDNLGDELDTLRQENEELKAQVKVSERWIPRIMALLRELGEEDL